MSSAHSPTFPSLHLRSNSFSNPSVALPTSQLILRPFRCFTYITVHSPTLLSLLSCVTSSSLIHLAGAHVQSIPLQAPVHDRINYYSAKTSVRLENMRRNRTTHSTCQSRPSPGVDSEGGQGALPPPRPVRSYSNYNV